MNYLKSCFAAAGVLGAILLITACFSASQPTVAGQEVKKSQPTTKPHNFARWEKSIAAFEEADRFSPPPKGAVLFVGASTITLWKTLAKDFPDHKIINRGFGGSEIVDTTHFAERIIFPYEPKMIILRCGSNDIANGKRPEDVEEDFKAFVSKIRQRLPQVEIVFMSLNAIPSRWPQKDKDDAANQLIRAEIEKMPRVRFLDISDMVLTADGKSRTELFGPDRLHFNEAGYKLLAERVRPYLPAPPAITYPPLSSFLYGNTGVNAPPEKSFVQGPGFPFRILLPVKFDPKTKYPVIVYLHGGGETGKDNEKHLKAGKNSANGGLALVSTADPNNQADHPCIFVAPQMPVNNWYNAASVKAITDLLHLVKTQYPNAVDDERICLTGLSSGGMGSWNLPPQITPNPFSCLVPICAFSIYPNTTPKMPIWNFHAVNDPTESIYRGNRRPGELGSDVIVPKLRELGYSIIYTRYDTGGHSIWTTAYQHPLLLPWMFAQRRGQPQQGIPGLSIKSSSIENGMLTLTGEVPEKAKFTRVGWSTSAVKPSASKADGVGDGTNTFVSASSSFDKSFVGQRLGIPNKNADMGIIYYDIVEVTNPTTVKLSTKTSAGKHTFVTYPYGTMENPHPATGPISPTWKLTGIPIRDVKQVQVVAEAPSMSNLGGLTTMNLTFKVKDSAP